MRRNTTKQGVRDLHHLPSPPKRRYPPGLDCDHTRMRVCCFYDDPRRPCGHWCCDGCGLFVDDGDAIMAWGWKAWCRAAMGWNRPLPRRST